MPPCSALVLGDCAVQKESRPAPSTPHLLIRRLFEPSVLARGKPQRSHSFSQHLPGDCRCTSFGHSWESTCARTYCPGQNSTASSPSQIRPDRRGLVFHPCISALPAFLPVHAWYHIRPSHNWYVMNTTALAAVSHSSSARSGNTIVRSQY